MPSLRTYPTWAFLQGAGPRRLPEEVVSWEAPARPLISPGLGGAVGADPGSEVGDTLGRALLTGSPRSGGWRVSAARTCAQAPHRRVGFRQRAGGRPVTHDVTDNDTSRVSPSDTASELHNVTPGAPGTPRPPWREHLATHTPALRRRDHAPRLRGSWPDPAGLGARQASPAGGLASG